MPGAIVAEKLETAMKHKETGNELYKAKNFRKALYQYSCAIMYMKGMECEITKIAGTHGFTVGSLAIIDKRGKEK